MTINSGFTEPLVIFKIRECNSNIYIIVNSSFEYYIVNKLTYKKSSRVLFGMACIADE